MGNSFLVRPWFFASPVYFPVRREVEELVQWWLSYLDSSEVTFASPRIVMGAEELPARKELSEWPLLIFLSGGTQPWALEVITRHRGATFWFLHPSDGGFPPETISAMLARNALPALMDVWARARVQPNWLVTHCHDVETLSRALILPRWLTQIRGTTLLQVGKTEPWVISSERDLDRVRELTGVRVVQVPLEALLIRYREMQSSTGLVHMVTRYWNCAKKTVEPSLEDVTAAYRLYLALTSLMKEHGATVVAISCFALAKALRVTACVALSLINESRDLVAACEGDLDSAISLLVTKVVTGRPSFMGNVIVNLDHTIDMVHCTAPRTLAPGLETNVILRSHHETGCSVAQRVEIQGTKVPATLFRIGLRTGRATVARATFLQNVALPTCRTQWRFSVCDGSRFLDELLGNHQVVVFGDHGEDLARCCQALGFEACLL